MSIDPAVDFFDMKAEEVIYNVELVGNGEKAVIKQIDGDGSCLLRSLLDQLGRTND